MEGTNKSMSSSIKPADDHSNKVTERSELIRKSPHADAHPKEQEAINNTKPEAHPAVDVSKKKDEGVDGIVDDKEVNSMFLDQRTQQPCTLSSSIHYGGQDIYITSKSSQTPSYNSMKMNQEVPQEETGGKVLSITDDG
ncbi:hypothetical protein ACFE04_020481 [Oxalis oulophora]